MLITFPALSSREVLPCFLTDVYKIYLLLKFKYLLSARHSVSHISLQLVHYTFLLCTPVAN